MNLKGLKNILYNPLFGYVFSFAVGVYFGAATVKGVSVAVIYVSLMVACLYAAIQNRKDKVFSLLAYIVYGELYIRAYGRLLPYLICQYFFIALMIILFAKSRQGWRLHTRSFVVLTLYGIMEVLDIVRAADINTTRGIIVQTLTIVTVSIWGAFNFLTPQIINKLFTHIKYASLFLCGVMVTAQIGQIETLHSSYQTTNGLAPVQISGYLGFACVIFFWSVMNSTALNFKMIVNIFLLAFVCVFMLMSFSRGGFYFLAILAGLYFMLNTDKARSYTILIMLLPVALLTYSYVSNKTGGSISQRYQESGASGRDKLADIGWQLFESEPVAGIGTGNFSTEVQERNLYEMSGVHNEFVRSAAEHGIIGFCLYCGFFIFLFMEIFARSGVQREYAFYFLILFCLITVHNGLKISVQPLLLLLAVATPDIAMRSRKKNVQSSLQFATRS